MARFVVRLQRGGPWDWSRDLRRQDGWDEHAGFMDGLVGEHRVPQRLQEPDGPADDGHIRYVGSFVCERAGRYGLTVRVVPAHPDLATPTELGCIRDA